MRARSGIRLGPVRILGMAASVVCLVFGVLLILRPQVKVSERRGAIDGILAAMQGGQTQISVDPDALKIAGEPDPVGLDTEYETEDGILTLVGELKIDAIDLHLPILEGMTELQIRYGAGWLPQSAEVGEPGSCILFGHRMLEYGDLFNRFGELEAGDKVEMIRTDGETVSYTVREIIIYYTWQLPDVLFTYPEKDENLLARVTCDPIETAANRMIVWCEADRDLT